MGRRGPAPAPTALKVLHGETRPSRLNPREPKPPATAPKMPPSLSRPAAVYWRYYVGRLNPLRLLTELDRDALASLCEHEVNHAEMIRELRSTGYMVRGARFVVKGDDETEDRGFVLVKNPLVSMIRMEATLLHSLRAKFGLTPSDRSSMVTPVGPDDDGGLLS